MSASTFSPFQKQAAYFPSCGWPGDFGSRNAHYALVLHASVPMQTGIFAGYGAAPALDAPGIPANFVQAGAYDPFWGAPGNGSGGAPIGLISRPMARGFMDFRQVVQEDIAVGEAVEVYTQGDMMVWLGAAAFAAARQGMALFSDDATGAVSAAAVGGSVSGATQTAWRVFRKLSAATGAVLVSTFRSM